MAVLRNLCVAGVRVRPHFLLRERRTAASARAAFVKVEMKLSSEDRPNEDRLNEDRLNEDRHWPPWRRALALCACLFMMNILR
jgi:hypothetical protein